jgi:hypothetical protein
MIYVKSVLVGVLALFSATILYLVILISTESRRYQPPPGAEVSFDLRSVINHEPSFWLVALVAFGVGFYWEFRRATR